MFFHPDASSSPRSNSNNICNLSSLSYVSSTTATPELADSKDIGKSEGGGTGVAAGVSEDVIATTWKEELGEGDRGEERVGAENTPGPSEVRNTTPGRGKSREGSRGSRGEAGSSSESFTGRGATRGRDFRGASRGRGRLLIKGLQFVS